MGKTCEIGISRMKKNSIKPIFFSFFLLAFFHSAFAGGYCSRSGTNGGFPGFQSTPDPRTDSFGVDHYSIHLDLQDFQGKHLHGHTQVRIKSAVNNLTEISLDLMMLQLDSVKQNGQGLNYSYNDTLISIDLDQALNQGDTATISVWYQGTPFQNPADWGGFYWTSQYAFNIGVSFVEEPHNFGRVWFPCLDNFVDRATYDFFITTDSTRKAFCGGLLQQELSNPDGSKTWHWFLSQDIPTYLASVAVADYASLEWNYQGLERSIPVVLAARPLDTTNLRNSFQHLDSAIAAYEQMFLPYQFDRVGYAIVPFSAGAMEHACNIAYMRFAIDGSLAYESLMAHELSHHWWGDLVTCKTASDMWLNEGWASYSEFLFDEFVYGFDEYMREVRNNHERMLQEAHWRDGAYLPVSGVGHEHTYSTTVYNKGADMLHTLRSYLGDRDFFDCINQFLDQNKFSDITSEEFRDFLSGCSGIDLNYFFDDWIFQKGWANFTIDTVRHEEFGADMYATDVFIRQRLHKADHLYQEVPLQLTFFSDEWDSVTHTATVSGACSQFSTLLPFEPSFVAVDYFDKLSDATTAEFRVLNQTVLADFGTAKMLVDVDSISDSALLRVEHHWAVPDPFKSPMPGLHLSRNRFWRVDGLLPANFKASAEVVYDETAASAFLDKGLITNTEDSMALLYRPNPQSDWSLVPGFQIDVQVNPNNRRGVISWPDLKKGEYVLGIYDVGRGDTSFSVNPCLTTGINASPEQTAFEIFPNPGTGRVTVKLEEGIEAKSYRIYSLSGQLIYTTLWPEGKSQISFDMSEQGSGTYIFNIVDNHGRQINRTFIINQ